MTRLVLGGSEAERVELRFNLPQAPDREGWVETFADISVGGFRGSIRLFVEIADLIRFRDQLARLHETLNGLAELSPCEGQLLLTVQGNGGGGMKLKGHAHSEACYGNVLQFELELDQTHLVEPLRVLREIAEHKATYGA